MTTTVQIEVATSAAAIDTEVVRPWISAFLTQHLRWWSTSAGRTWNDAEIEAHIARNELVERDIAEMQEACAADDQYVGIIRDPGLVGIVYAAQRTCRYLYVPVGVVSWVAVDPRCRGKGYGRALIAAARSWMDARGCQLQEVFVTAPNRGAVQLYEKAGFEVVDHRMLASGVAPTGSNVD